MTIKKNISPEIQNIDSLEEADKTIKDVSYLDFPFPYAKPYPVQIDLMRKIFSTISDNKIGLLESPTGTGKSLSLLCSVLYFSHLHNPTLDMNMTKKKSPLHSFPQYLDLKLPITRENPPSQPPIATIDQQQTELSPKAEDVDDD